MYGDRNAIGGGSIAGAGLAMNQSEATRQTEIPERMQMLESSLHTLGDVIEGLASRLSPVTRSLPPETGAKANTLVQAIHTDMGARLHSHEERVQRLTEQVRSILQRLEL